MATEIPIDFELIKRTYRISVKYDWLSTPWREKLSKFFLAHGANKVKRTGSGQHQHLYVSWVDDKHSDEEIKAITREAISQFVEGKNAT